jgi:Zn-dependent peptidase ImmA (M78 family)
MTVAHELGHFLLDYVEPRLQVLREAPDLLEVVDGWRAPTRAERVQAVLARVPLGLRTHLLERDVQGNAEHDVEMGEDAASRFAVEVLAPWPAIRDLARQLRSADPHASYGALLATLTVEVVEQFLLPQAEASARAAAALETVGVRRSFLDR